MSDPSQVRSYGDALKDGSSSNGSVDERQIHAAPEDQRRNESDRRKGPWTSPR